MESRKISPFQFIVVGILTGMAIVLGAYMLIKPYIQPEPVKHQVIATQRSNTPNPEKEYCPVCKKEVNNASDFFEELYGRKYYFCSDICLRSFRDQPLLYLKDMKINVDIEFLKENQSTQPESASQNDENDASDTTQNDKTEAQIDAQPDTSAGSDTAVAPESDKASNSNSNSDTDNIPLPDEIVSSPAPAKPEKVKESRQAPPPRKTQTPTSDKLNIEEIPLDGNAGNGEKIIPTPAKNTPAPKKTAAPQSISAPKYPPPQPTQEMEIEEIPLN